MLVREATLAVNARIDRTIATQYNRTARLETYPSLVDRTMVSRFTASIARNNPAHKIKARHDHLWVRNDVESNHSCNTHWYGPKTEISTTASSNYEHVSITLYVEAKH